MVQALEKIASIDKQIGQQAEDDWKLKPLSFSDFLGVSTPKLAAFLNDSLYVEKGKRFHSADTDAVAYQNRFKRRARHVSVAIFVSAAATALLAALPNWSEQEGYIATVKVISLVAGLIAFIASGIAIYNNQMIGQLKLYDQWMTHRAKAEIARLSYFREAAVQLVKHHHEDRELLVQYCSFFKRFQLELQQNYYTGRSKQHAISLKGTAKLGAIAAVIIACSSGASGLLGFVDSSAINFAAIGTLGIALTALASRFESINQDERNAARYQITGEALSRVAEKYSRVQTALIEEKNAQILVQFVDAVHEQISLEHRQWTDDTADISSAYADLAASVNIESKAKS